MVSRAFLNPSEHPNEMIDCNLMCVSVYIPWDVEDFYLKHVKCGRDKKRLKFPIPNFGAFSDPLTVVDAKGRIVLWYLPGLLSSVQRVGVYLDCISK